MKKLIYSAALFAATMIGFTSCDKDDDDSNADVKKTAVGDYTIKTDFYLSDGKTLSKFSDKDYPAAPGKIVSTDGGLQMQSEDDVISLINIVESSNGFTCDVKEITVNDKDAETGETYTYTITGFNGYEQKYHGGYNSSTKTLEFYLDWPMDNESLGWCALNLPENADLLTELAPIINENEEAALPKIEELGAKYKYVVKYTCVKK
ncbi:MAG: hypothetical protein J6W13_03935 [Salinivirgaceae bacterium]|nr:hypothetical protein [Salinivirgaceae bacterium]